MPQTRSNLLLWVVVGGGVFLFLTLSLLALAFYFGSSSALSLSSNQVLELDLEGVIFDSKQFVEQLKEWGKRPAIKAVVVRINSPGGGVAASQEMYEAVKSFRNETHKKVVVSMSSVAASGGYYVALAGDRIFANPGTITGSIGVIAEWYNYGDLLRWAKMHDVVFKSGELKDSGSPTREMTPAEKEYFQSLINNMFAQFVAAVANSRKMDTSVVTRLADGRVFTGQEAKEKGLIDELGTLEDAVKAAGKMAGIRGEPKVVTPPKKSFSILDFVLGDSRSLLPIDSDRSESHIRFQYLWR
jgi:protease IV